MVGEDITGKGSIPASQLKPPAVFEKARSSVAGPGDRVCIPEGTTGVSASAELAGLQCHSDTAAQGLTLTSVLCTLLLSAISAF